MKIQTSLSEELPAVASATVFDDQRLRKKEQELVPRVFDHTVNKTHTQWRKSLRQITQASPRPSSSCLDNCQDRGKKKRRPKLDRKLFFVLS